MEQREPTKEELERMIGEMREFVEKLSKEMHDKQTSEILPIDIALIVSVCLTRLFTHTPSTVMLKNELMNTATLIANSVLKFQEQKTKEAQALDKLWEED